MKYSVPCQYSFSECQTTPLDLGLGGMKEVSTQAFQDFKLVQDVSGLQRYPSKESKELYSTSIRQRGGMMSWKSITVDEDPKNV